jgi:hypothetical protein
MKNDLTEEQLKQPVTVTLPLGVVLNINGNEDSVFVEPSGAERLAHLKTSRPNIGSKGLYGIYAGNVRAAGNEPDGILEVLGEAPGKMTWSDAIKWAELIGGRLPTRAEQAVLFGNVPELFQKEWYWSGEQYAGADAWAWYQFFDNGGQYYGGKDYELRARAVRRLAIQ